MKDLNNDFSNEDEFIELKTNSNIIDTLKTNHSSNYAGYNWYQKFSSSSVKSFDYQRNNNTELLCKNEFLDQISKKTSLINWVDIENEYYYALLECLNNKRREGIENLNNEFLKIQNKLEEYLSMRIQKLNGPSLRIQKIFHSIFELINYDKEKTKNGHYTVTFLNFNYTNTLSLYKEFLDQSNQDIRIINIHGELNNHDNPIIFGYGDELDENYRNIEAANDNRFLKNIKTTKYMESNNYQKMLAFIKADKYHLFNIGLSCGNSDGTLLHTIFENVNCTRITNFYHINEDGTDNYSDLIMNISRSFSDKSLMREIIANKLDCEPINPIA